MKNYSWGTQRKENEVPPCGFDDLSIRPLLLFLRANYAEVLRIARAKRISIEEAMEEELDRLQKQLARLHLTKDGELVERSPSEAT